MIINRILLLLAILLIGRVIGVTDGDTVKLLTADKQSIKIRLYGIDAPEKSQDFGQASKKYLSGLIYDKDVKVEITDTDRYGRSIGKIYLNDKYINLEMVKSGMAWWYRQYAKHDTELRDAEQIAKELKTGLWIMPNPIEPAIYRKGE